MAEQEEAGTVRLFAGSGYNDASWNLSYLKMEMKEVRDSNNM